MTCIRVAEKSASIESLDLLIVAQQRSSIGEGECMIEVHSAGVNPSDAKAVLGFMPHAVWPRTPGRDYAGIVLDGPTDSQNGLVSRCQTDLGRSRRFDDWLLLASIGSIMDEV